MRGFFRFSTRDLFILMGAVGLLLAVLSTWWRGDLTELQKAKVQQRLRVAAEAGDEAAVSRALREGAELGAFENGHHEALQAAIKRGHIGVLEVMLEAGCDVTHPMHVNLAVTTNQPEALQRLIAAVGTENLESAARNATQQGHPESLKVLLDAGAMGSLFDVTHQYSTVPWDKRLEVMRLLLERRKAARESGFDDSAELESSLTHAVQTIDAEMGDLLCEYGATYTLREAIVFNRIDHVREMLDDDPELLNSRLLPVEHVHREMAPTPLGLALQHARREIALEMIERGAPLHDRELHNCTNMHLGAIGGDPVLIKRLVAAGLAVNEPSADGYPLNYAVWQQHVDAARVLIEAGAQVNLAHQNSLLHGAAMANNPKIAKLLLDAGASPAAVNREGKTPRDIAEQFGHQDVLKVLDEAMRAPAESDATAANSATDPDDSFERNEDEKRQSLP
jgi:ankyrin repeat protein